MNAIMNHPLIAGIGPLGNMEIVVIAILVLILFGAKKLPTFARSLGRSMGEFRKAKDEFEQELHRAADEPATPPTAQTHSAAPDVKRIPSPTEV
jgi:sec-independent protein translocase protein TatA